MIHANTPAKQMAELTFGLVTHEDFQALVDAYMETGNMFLYHTANAVIQAENNYAMSKMFRAQSDLLPPTEQVQLPAEGGE